MTIGEYTQASILGESEAADSEVVIETNGRQIRPLTSLLSYLVDELKLHVTEDGLRTLHVEPANVGMNELHIHPEAFERYELTGDEFTAGVFVDKLHTAVEPARKPHKDAVEIRLDDRQTLVSIAKEYPMGTIQWTDRLVNIDPDAVREEPEPLDDTIGGHLMWSAMVQTLPFKECVDHLSTIGDHLLLAERDGHMVARSTAATRASFNDDDDDDDERDLSNESFVDFGDIAEAYTDDAEAGAESYFSVDYLTDMAKALLDADLDTIDVVWGDECPLSIRFEQTDDDGNVLVEGAFHLAPRIKSD